MITGGVNDFDNIQGLANLVAYAVMKGSQSYTIPYDFIRFVDKVHDGNYDEHETGPQDQQFSFSIDPKHLAPALDRSVYFIYLVSGTLKLFIK